MQRLLRSACRDAGAARDEVRGYVVDHLGAGDGVLIVDETGCLRKGRGSAGVQRQCTGTAGRIENSQVGVFLAYSPSSGRALIYRCLHLPAHSWSRDSERRRKAGVPEDVVFTTKPRLALQMIEQALDAGVSTSVVTGDEAYGQDPGLRAGLEARRVGYVLGGVLRDQSADQPRRIPNRPARSGHPVDLTVPEVRRLIGTLFGPPITALNALLPWSNWRRSHQASARRSHYRQRLSAPSSA